MYKVTIIGTGLIGSSLGLALKKHGGPDIRIVGHDKESRLSSKARKMGAVDSTERNLSKAVHDATIVILAIPVVAMREVLELIGPVLPQGSIVTDTGSTKKMILEWAHEYLPKGISFVGGHPFAGKEEAGPDAAEVGLFSGRPYCIIPGKGTEAAAVKTIIDLATLIGAKPCFMDAEEHDSFAAAISHLPMLLSIALVGVTSKSPSWGELAKLTSSGYRDVSRLASGDPEMGVSVCLTNSDNVVYWLDRFIKELQEIKQLVGSKDSSAALSRIFLEAWQARQKWQEGSVWVGGVEPKAVPIGSFSDRMGDLVFGTRVMELQKKIIRDIERKERTSPRNTDGPEI